MLVTMCFQLNLFSVNQWNDSHINPCCTICKQLCEILHELFCYWGGSVLYYTFTLFFRLSNWVGCLWLVTLMLVVMWLADCNPSAWKNQQEQTVGMSCSPGAVTTIGTWIDFWLISQLWWCMLLLNQKKQVMRETGNGWFLPYWIMWFPSLPLMSDKDRTTGLDTQPPKSSEGNGREGRLPSS